MNIELIKSELEKLNTLISAWHEGETIAAIEQNLALDILSKLYELVRFAQMTPEPATVPVAIEEPAQPSQQQEAEIEPEDESEAEVEVELIFADEDEECEEDVECEEDAVNTEFEEPENYNPEQPTPSAEQTEQPSIESEITPEAEIEAEQTQEATIEQIEEFTEPDEEQDDKEAMEMSSIANKPYEQDNNEPQSTSNIEWDTTPDAEQEFVGEESEEEESFIAIPSESTSIEPEAEPTPIAEPESKPEPTFQPEPEIKPEAPATTEREKRANGSMGSLFGSDEIQRKPRSKHQRMMALYNNDPQPKQEKIVDISKIFEIDDDDIFEITTSPNSPSAEHESLNNVATPAKTEEPTTLAEAIAPATQTLADTITAPAALAEEITNARTRSLQQAIGLNDKFLMIRDLFDGDAKAYEQTIAELDSLPSFEECMVYIIENHEWNPDSEGAKFIMQLLDRKFS